MVYLRKYFLFSMVISIMGILISCQDKIFSGSVNCDECYSDKPDSLDLILHLTINNQYAEVPVLLFQGDVDTGILIDTFFCFADPAYIWVKSNSSYSARAIYKTTDKTIMVIDGTKQELKRVTSTCDTECWVIEGEELQLKLAF